MNSVVVKRAVSSISLNGFFEIYKRLSSPAVKIIDTANVSLSGVMADELIRA